MSIPIIYADTQYVAAKHSFKTIPEGTNLSLTSLTSITTNNVMTLKEANVGIGTTAPRQLLDVQGGNAIVSGSIGIGTTVARQLLDVQGGDVIFSGNIGIGTTNPRATLHVEGDITSPALVGQVAYFAMSTAPTGWLKCNGASLSRTTYARLFSAIGTTFGSVNGSSFTLPDLRGEFLRSWDDARGIDSGRVFGTGQSAAMLNHTHTGSFSGTTVTAGSHTHSYDYRYGSGSTDIWHEKTNTWLAPAGGGGGAGTASTGAAINSAGTHDHSFSGSVTTGNPSVGGDNETRPRNIALLACIKY